MSCAGENFALNSLMEKHELNLLNLIYSRRRQDTLLASVPLYTRLRIVVVVVIVVVIVVVVGVGVGVGVNLFNFTRKRLGVFSSNCAYTFIVLLINYSKV